MTHNGANVPTELRGNSIVDKATFAPSEISLEKVCFDFGAKLTDAGFNYGENHLEFVRAFVSSMATKRFVILSGLSGAGKTRMAVAMGEWFGGKRLLVEAVRPDWTTPDAIL